MADEIQNKLNAYSKLIPGSNGIFDVYMDEKLIFSKFKTGRFPNPDEIINKIKEQNLKHIK